MSNIKKVDERRYLYENCCCKSTKIFSRHFKKYIQDKKRRIVKKYICLHIDVCENDTNVYFFAINQT